MSSLKTFLSLSTLAFVTACTSLAEPGTPSSSSAPASAHASHHPNAAPTASTADMQGQMKAMRQMHDQMMAAKTPSQRQALMADHMKSMQGGMAMMKSMGCTGPMGAASGTGAAMFGGAMAQQPQAMEGCMQMMQMMMEMMSQRVPTAPASK